MAFAIVFTLFVIGFLLVIGFNQIQDFFCVGSTAQTFKAVQDVEDLTEEVYILSKGSGKTYPLNLPGGSKLCFLNTTDPRPHPYTNPERTWNPDPVILRNILQNPNSPQYGSNLWIYSCGNSLGEGAKLAHVSPSKSFCASGGDVLFLENKGRSVDISPRDQ